jgi:hypothetical protein
MAAGDKKEMTLLGERIRLIDDGDGTFSLAAVMADASGNPVTPGVASSGLITNMNVTNAFAALPAAPLANRKSVRIWNPAGNVPTLYVGYANTVTAGAPSNGGLQGVPVAPGQVVTFSVGPGQVLYGIFSVAGPNVVQVEEVA